MAEHTLLLCPWVARVWNSQQTNLQIDAQEVKRIDDWLDKFTSKKPHLPSLETIGNLLWQVWKERNNFIFRGTKPEVCKVIDLARSQQNSYQKWGYGEEPAVKTEEPKNPPTWRAPKTSCLKLNIDESLGEESTEGAVAYVVRNSFGTLLDGFTKTVWAELVLQVETLGVLEGLKFLKEKALDEVVETNSKLLVDNLKHELQAKSNACGALQECHLLLQQMPRVDLAHCPRSANSVAD
ncbi:uncharacterized protein LOC120288726 [Eucalyptus grandis]|uniref:uncharacterized protein LOC120288726 n=1 Tax=Eucalyptus grandis TaxID=71139 RepID=UPI00192EF990|nr:uncharacterized protein LOC120288726 [Eucalyptus grandis]